MCCAVLHPFFIQKCFFHKDAVLRQHSIKKNNSFNSSFHGGAWLKYRFGFMPSLAMRDHANDVMIPQKPGPPETLSLVEMLVLDFI